jgi:hypothetical protein
MKSLFTERSIATMGTALILAGLAAATRQPATSQNAIRAKAVPVLFLPYSSSVATDDCAFQVTNTGNGGALCGYSANSNGVFGHSDTGTGIWAEGDYGLISLGKSVGVYALDSSTYGTGTASYGYSASGIGVHGQSASGTGVYGSSTDQYGVSGSSTNYIGVIGGSQQYAGVFGYTYGTNDYSYGVQGVSEYKEGYGVYANNYNGGTHSFLAGWGVGARAENTLGAGVGVWGVSNSGGSGVWGQSNNSVGVSGTSLNYIGINGYSGYGYGVQGEGGYIGVRGIGDSASVVAVEAVNYGSGDLLRGWNSSSETFHVTNGGAIYGSSKHFKIDDPVDPANKYLIHASIESAEMKNLYDGVVTLDAQGEAWVQLPKWFEALNTDFRYQLTAIGAPGSGLYIAQEIAQGRFLIAGGAPGMKVSWQVTGVRQDAYAKAHPMQVEQVKPREERGKFLHPVELGFPETRGMGYNYIHQQQVEAQRSRKALDSLRKR